MDGSWLKGAARGVSGMHRVIANAGACNAAEAGDVGAVFAAAPAVKKYSEASIVGVDSWIVWMEGVTIYCL